MNDKNIDYGPILNKHIIEYGAFRPGSELEGALRGASQFHARGYTMGAIREQENNLILMVPV